MSSSSPPLVPLVSCELRSSPTSPPSHGSSASARVSHCVHKTSRGASDMLHQSDALSRIGSSGSEEFAYSNRVEDFRGESPGFQDLRIGGSIEGPACDQIPVAPSTPSNSAAAQAHVVASLNPLAREFVPGTASSPPSNEWFGARVEADTANSTEPSFLDASVSVGDRIERVGGIKNAEIDKERSRPSPWNKTQGSGGLSSAFKRGGRTGQSRVCTLSNGATDGSSTQPATGLGKRGQFTNANHLLNFQYNPIVRPPPVPRNSNNRKSQKVQPFNKELFLQANFRFLVSDFGDYLLNSLDPDKMLQWEDIAAVNISAPVPIQCPICLETPPVCPQITSCGHIFCFPCILRYLVLGEDEQRNEHFKKCPLCFAMTSSKELRTVFVDTVHNHQVGDTIELTLLNRARGSIIPFEKSQGFTGALPYSKDGQCHSFSKITLTSDAEQMTNNAIRELTSWAEKAQNAAGEDMDLIPFALLAIDQLQQRKLAWNDHRASEFLSSSPPLRQRLIAQTKESAATSASQEVGVMVAENDCVDGLKGASDSNQRGEKLDVAAETQAAMANLKNKAGWVYESAFSDDDGVGLSNSRSRKVKHHASEPTPSMIPGGTPSSWEEVAHKKMNSNFQTSEGSSHLNKDVQQVTRKEDEDNECYAFFQCADGQPLIMHPLNMKCLLQHFGSYENLPSRLQVRILEMEGQIQTEALRKRYRYLSHLPLTTNFWFCEVDLRGAIPASAFIPFTEELRNRETRRRRRQKQEQAERSREEKMSAAHTRSSPPAEFISFIEEDTEDKQALNTESQRAEDCPDPMASSPEPIEQRKLFSQVTRLGFASAHDAPVLTPAKIAESSQEKSSGGSTGAPAGKLPTMSFADIIQSQPSKPVPTTARNGADGLSQSSSKKNKKASRVLLSTAGGRRY